MANIVYVVDDDIIIRRALAISLREAGFVVHPFSSGVDFLEARVYLKPGCVLLDVYMPEIDGLAVQHHLSDVAEEFPVILMTGYGDIPTAVKGMRGGAIDFIEKPIREPYLIELLGRIHTTLPDDQRRSSNREKATAQIATLSGRERDIVAGLLAGLPNKLIAFHLNVGVRTIETHRANAMRKLQLRSVAEVVQLAMEAGMKPLGKA